jgi:hypothetical protein
MRKKSDQKDKSVNKTLTLLTGASGCPRALRPSLSPGHLPIYTQPHLYFLIINISPQLYIYLPSETLSSRGRLYPDPILHNFTSHIFG